MSGGGGMVRGHVSRSASPGHHRGTGTGHPWPVVRHKHCLSSQKFLLAYPATGKGSGKEEMISLNENRRTKDIFTHKTIISSLKKLDCRDQDNSHPSSLPS